MQPFLPRDRIDDGDGIFRQEFAQLRNKSLKRSRLYFGNTVRIQYIRNRAEHLDLVAGLIRLNGKL